MPNIIGKIPEFTDDETSEKVEEVKSEETQDEEVKEEEASSTEGGEATSEEKETPSEPPAEEQPAEQDDDLRRDDTRELEKQVSGLQDEKEKLLTQIRDLRGERREIKQDELQKVEETIDELKDLHPEDVKTIEKVLRAKGYITKDESGKMFYDAVKQEQLDKFLVKYPEYKPENDSSDINWSSLQKELGFYKMPSDPHKIGEVLERAHNSVTKVSSDRGIEAKKRQIETASVGGGGAQRSSSSSSLDPAKKDLIRTSMSGWSEEEIKKIEQKLSE